MLQKGAALLAVAFLAGCGSSIATDKPEPIERRLVYEKIVGERGIWIADVDGSNPRLLVPRGNQPAISLDGKWVAYSGECRDWDTSACNTLYIVSTRDAARPRRLSTVVGGTITWSPDSKRVVGESMDNLLSIEVESGKAVEVAKGPFSGWSISPDGKQVVFAREEKPNGDLLSGFDVDLFVADVGGGDAKRITDTDDATRPVWGPTSIAYSRLISCLAPPELQPVAGCRNNTWGRHEIWQVQPDGSGMRSITGTLPGPFQMQGCVGLDPVAWSEDGRELLAGWLCEFSHEPVAVDPESGKIRTLGGGASAAGLSRDGRFALVEGGGGAEPSPKEQNVMIVPYAGGKPDVVATGAVAPSWNR